MIEDLTPREYRILYTYFELENIAKTAEHLGLSHSTVRGALSERIYPKLDTRNIIGALKAAGWAKVPR